MEGFDEITGSLLTNNFSFFAVMQRNRHSKGNMATLHVKNVFAWKWLQLMRLVGLNLLKSICYCAHH